MKPLTEILPPISQVPRLAAVSAEQAPHDASPLPAEVAKLFACFSRLFGARWERTATDPQAPRVWERAFQAAGVKPTEIRRGLELSSQLAWPPSAGEFIALAKAEPSDADAFGEAARWACGRKGAEPWSHPAVATAAARVGAWKLRFESESVARRVFIEAYRECITDHRRGRLTEREPLFALESPQKSRPHITAEERERVKATHIADLARFLGLQGGAA